MKTDLVIGIGKFGYHLAKTLMERGNEVMVVDKHEDVIEEIAPLVTKAQIGDCTRPEVLEALEVSSFNECFVCTGSNFQSSLEITALLKDMGAKHVISKATSAIQEKFLLRNGADEVIYPERASAEKLATCYSSDKLFEYFELTANVSIFEIEPLDSWVNKTIRTVDVRAKYNANVLAYKDGDDVRMLTGPDYEFKKNEHVLVLGRNEDINKMLRKGK